MGYHKLQGTPENINYHTDLLAFVFQHYWTPIAQVIPPQDRLLLSPVAVPPEAWRDALPPLCCTAAWCWEGDA